MLRFTRKIFSFYFRIESGINRIGFCVSVWDFYFFAQPVLQHLLPARPRDLVLLLIIYEQRVDLWLALQIILPWITRIIFVIHFSFSFLTSKINSFNN